MEKVIGLGLEAGEQLIDKYFDKLPDRYFQERYFRNKVPRPAWRRKSRKADNGLGHSSASESDGESDGASDGELDGGEVEERRKLPPATYGRNDEDFEDYSDDDKGREVKQAVRQTGQNLYRHNNGSLPYRPKHQYGDDGRHMGPENTGNRVHFSSADPDEAFYEVRRNSRSQYPSRHQRRPIPDVAPNVSPLHPEPEISYPYESRQRSHVLSGYGQATPTPTLEPQLIPPPRSRSLHLQRSRYMDPIPPTPRTSPEASRFRRRSVESMPHLSQERSRSRGRDTRRDSGLKDIFSTSELGLGAGGLGALAGGLLASEMTKDDGKKKSKVWPEKMKDERFLATLLGSVVGGLGANVLEKEWERAHEKKKGALEKRGTW